MVRMVYLVIHISLKLNVVNTKDKIMHRREYMISFSVVYILKLYELL